MTSSWYLASPILATLHLPSFSIHVPISCKLNAKNPARISLARVFTSRVKAEAANGSRVLLIKGSGAATMGRSNTSMCACDCALPMRYRWAKLAYLFSGHLWDKISA